MRTRGNPKEAAIRECREELGMVPKKLEKLTTFSPNPARIDWPAHIFYCESVESSRLELNDPSENVERALILIIKLRKLIDEGEIADPALLIGWYTACSRDTLFDSSLFTLMQRFRKPPQVA